MAQTTQTSLSLGTPFSGTFAGSGQPQLFAVNVPTAAPLSLQLTDPTKTDHVELYAQFGTPPTRQVYGEAANGAGASQSLLIPSAAAGTWYVLVYAESVSRQQHLHAPGECDAGAGDRRDSGEVRDELDRDVDPDRRGLHERDLRRAGRRGQYHDLSGQHASPSTPSRSSPPP